MDIFSAYLPNEEKSGFAVIDFIDALASNRPFNKWRYGNKCTQLSTNLVSKLESRA